MQAHTHHTYHQSNPIEVKRMIENPLHTMRAHPISGKKSFSFILYSSVYVSQFLHTAYADHDELSKIREKKLLLPTENVFVELFDLTSAIAIG